MKSSTQKLDVKKVLIKQSSSRLLVTNPYKPMPFKVLDYYRETADIFTLTVNMPIQHKPGQFVQVSLPGIGEAPISLCSDSNNFIKLNIREVGRVTKEIAKLKVSDTIFIRGPYGNGYPMEQLAGNGVILVGGGCGVAPLKGVIDYIEHHRDQFEDVILFLGYRSPNDILFKKELVEWKERYHLTVTVDQNPEHQFCYEAGTGFITDALNKSNLTNTNKVAFLCGPPIMMKAATTILQQKGFHEDQIFHSAERLMYCALGVCCHCMIRGKYTCIDGPVFRYDTIKDFKND